MTIVKKRLVWEGGRCCHFSKIVVEEYIDPQESSVSFWRYIVYNRNGGEMFFKDGLKSKPPKKYTMERFF